MTRYYIVKDGSMSSSKFQVQYILRAYSRHLANLTRFSKGFRNKEEVTISKRVRRGY